MEAEVWKGELSRRGFLLGTVGLASFGGLLEACASLGGSPASASVHYPKAKIDGDLEFFNWSQYLSPDVIKAFEQHYGVKVHQTYFDNEQSMMAKLNAGIPYDVTFPTMDFADQLIRANAVQPIDPGQLKHWSQVPSYFHRPWYDSSGVLHSVPYALWTTGICWRTDLVGSLGGSWNDFWTHPQANGKIFLLDDLQETLGMSLLRLHYDINSGNSSQLNRAGAQVIDLKPRLRGFSTDDITNLVNGNAWIHHAWSGDVYQVLQQVDHPENYNYETCKEGVPTGNDTFVIPRHAKHPGTAMLFIDWMLAPENATANVQYFGYPQVTKAGIKAFEQLASKYPFLQISLDQAIRGLREIAPTGSKLQLWDREWARVKAA